MFGTSYLQAVCLLILTDQTIRRGLNIGQMEGLSGCGKKGGIMPTNDEQLWPNQREPLPGVEPVSQDPTLFDLEDDEEKVE